MNQPEEWGPRYVRAAARAIRPRPWLKVHIPLMYPYIDRARSERIMVDLGDGCAVTLYVRPEHVPRSICYFDQIEPLLGPGQAEADPIEPLAAALVRSLPW